MMKRKTWKGLSAIAIATVAMLGVGCSSEFLTSFFAPLGSGTSVSGTVKLTFVNETNYRVTTYWGVYNPLDLTENVAVQKLVLEAGKSNGPLTGFCARQIDVAGPDLRFVAKESGITTVNYANITDTTAFSTVVGSTEIPAGTAQAAQFHIGVNFDCGDTVQIRFKQDATTKAFSVQMVVVEED